jgi:hypothetical protein
MIWGIACIAEEKDFLVIGFSTNGAGSDLFLLKFVLDPCIWVEFGYLLFVLDLIFRYDGAWRKRISILNYFVCLCSCPSLRGDLWLRSNSALTREFF